MINLGFMGFPMYDISTKGKVYNIKTHKEVKPQPSGRGYLRVKLYNNGEYKRFDVHVLMARAYLKPEFSPFVVNHIDTDKHNNDLKNLELITQSGNIKHAYRNGRRSTLRGRKVWVLRDYNGNIRIYANINDASKDWKMPERIWKVMSQEIIR